MTVTTRMRETSRINLSGAQLYRGTTNAWSATLIGRQVTQSEGHAWPKDRGVRDAGGNFDTIRLVPYVSDDAKGPYFAGPYTDVLGTRTYSGDFFVHVNTGNIPQEFRTDGQSPMWYTGFVPTSNLDALGSTFVSQTIPTNSVVDASVSLAELFREGIPLAIGSQLLRDKASFFRSLGSEYLNIEFGWKPLVNDIKNAAKAIIDSDDILQQLSRDSGRDVHRKRHLPVLRTDTVVTNNQSTGGFGLDGQFYSTQSRFYRSTTFTREQWFSGCYTYHYDSGQMSEVERIVTQARLLYGLELTPEVLWNLAPWSWLADWVFNIGPVLHNVSMFQSDGLVMRYGYVMEENSRTDFVQGERGTVKGGTNLPIANVVVYRGLRKTRRKASPFGFGLDFAGFSTRQWAILAALGITRAPRTL